MAWSSATRIRVVMPLPPARRRGRPGSARRASCRRPDGCRSRTSPPSSMARSPIPRSPNERGFGRADRSMPTPSSRTVRTASSPDRSSRTSTRFARACRATLVSDSCMMRNSADACGSPSWAQAGVDAQVAADARALGEALRQPLRGGAEAQIVEHQRAQVRRDPARGGDGGIEELAHRLRPLEQIGALRRERAAAGDRRPSSAR